MLTFAEHLNALPTCEELAALELRDANGALCGVIENKPGSAGSLRIYACLAKKWSCINADAAREGLDMYSEHTADAKNNPGKHPNIDRLFDVLLRGVSYEVRFVSR